MALFSKINDHWKQKAINKRTWDKEIGSESQNYTIIWSNAANLASYELDLAYFEGA